MRIAFVTTELPSLKKGAPVRNYNLIKQAVLSGASVDLITIAPAKQNLRFPCHASAHLV